jgi:hypothetical protein
VHQAERRKLVFQSQAYSGTLLVIRRIKTILARIVARRWPSVGIDSHGEKSIVTAVGYYVSICEKFWDNVVYGVSEMDFTYEHL